MKVVNSILILAVAGAIGSFTYLAKHSDLATGAETRQQQELQSKSYILQGFDSEQLSTLVANVGGDIGREFPIINAVSATLTTSQVEQIKNLGNVTVQDDRTVRTMNTGGQSFFLSNNIAKEVNADKLHAMDVKGKNVTVAIVDSGANLAGNIGSFLFADSSSRVRIPVKYDAFNGRINYSWVDDFNGHGTHVTSIIASSFNNGQGEFNSIAPDVTILPVKAFDQHGNSSYSKVLDALNWIYQNRHTHGIRVVNMSLGATPTSHYWQDPVNQAVMRLWDAGIVVVVSAGNNGKEMGITVPGNTPYVLTVGAATDNGTPLDKSDDRIATFSAQGPTVEGFIKPDVVAYGASIAVKMDTSYFIRQLRASLFGQDYSEISGTSQAAAIVSGVAALVLSNNPHLSPDDVKCRIVSTAALATSGNTMAFSPFKQGAGLVDAYAAVMSNASGCGNQGLDIKQDLAGIQHFQGPARVDQNGVLSIVAANGQTFTEGVHWDNVSSTTDNSGSSTERVNLAPTATLDTSYVSPWENLSAVTNGINPTWSNDKTGGAYGNWRGWAGYNQEDWLSLSWTTPKTISELEVYWWVDYRGILTPYSAKVEYWDGSNWVYIDEVERRLHRYNDVDFDEITTTSIRVKMQSAKSTGILEIKVWGHEAVSVNGTHWGNEGMNLKGTFWGNETVNLFGTHWGNEVVNLQGTHWNNETMGLQGTFWGNEVINLLGTYWGNEGMSLQGTHWENEIIGIQENGSDAQPIDPNAVIVIDESKWK